MRKRVDRLGSEAREAAGELGAFAVDSVQGLGEIVAFQQEQARGARLDALSERHIRLRLPFFRELTLQQSLLEVFTGLGGLAVVVIGAALAARGTVDPAVLPLLTLLAMAAFLPVSEIAQVGRQLADTLGATRRIYALAERAGTGDRRSRRSRPGRRRHAGAGAGELRLSRPEPARALRRELRDSRRARRWRWSAPPAPARRRRRSCCMRFWDPDDGRITLNGVDLRQYGSTICAAGSRWSPRTPICSTTRSAATS